MLNLITLPYELLSRIVVYIDFDDVFSLGLTCKSFRFFIFDERLARSIVQNKIPFAPEAIQANARCSEYARALRLVAKRREAFATVSPYTVATLGFCDDYLYCKGVLCYSLDDEVRVLDLHHSGTEEIVVSISGLLTGAILDIHQHHRGTFKILYYSDDIVACLYKTLGPYTLAWLIVFSLEDGRILIPPEKLHSIRNIFVRHNKDFLYYGTHSELDFFDHRIWVIQGYDFGNKKWVEKKIRLSGMAGHDVGSTVCFEIHADYFYAISSQTPHRTREINPTSIYRGYRFPLNSPCEELLERTNDDDMWRRQHQEGPLDERWMFIQLDVDETTGKLKIIEGRKEWIGETSKRQRSYYTTDIIFPKDKEEEYESQDKHADAIEEAIPSCQPVVGNQSSSTASPGFSASTSTLKATSSSLNTPLSLMTLYNNTDFPNSLLIHLGQKPYDLAAPPRCPCCTHPADDFQSTFTIAKTCVRAYIKSSNTYLDLVNDPHPKDFNRTQRVRLLAESRKQGPPLVDAETGLSCDYSDDVQKAIKQLYRNTGITFWPRVEENITEAQLDDIYAILNPPDFIGHVQGTCDDRSLVYVTGEKGKPQALIFVGFDAGIRLKGLRRWGQVDKMMKGVGEGPHSLGGATGGVSGVTATATATNQSIDRKGKGRERDVGNVGHVGSVVQLSDALFSGSHGETNEVGNWRSGFEADGDAMDFGFDEGAGDTKSASSKVRRGGTLINRVPAMYLALTHLGYNFGMAQDGLGG